MNILIASYLEPEWVERIRAVDPAIRVEYHPHLMPAPRYPADHVGHPLVRTAVEDAEWRGLLAAAEVMFDFDRTHASDLPDLAPRVRWIQATSAGIGQFVHRHAYPRRMAQTAFTTAAGVHAQPLAEFCLAAMLNHVNRMPLIQAGQRRHHWERFAGTDLEGRTVLIVGAGAIGAATARICRAFGMRTLGIKRAPAGCAPAALHLDELGGPDALDGWLPRADFVILCTPHTPDTEHLLGPHRLGLLPPRAYLINIGRGALIDEAALIAALESGRLAGACLDVFETEPLPADSPFWDMPQVIVSPHSGSTSDRENERLTDLFCDNLSRYLDGAPLRNRFEADRMY